MLDATRSGKLPRLEALFAEDGPALRRAERHGRFLAARRTRRDRLDAFPSCDHPLRSARALGLAGLAPLGLVLEVLVGEELLFTGRPDELRTAVDAPEDPVLELHRSLPRRVGLPLLPRTTLSDAPTSNPGRSLTL